MRPARKLATAAALALVVAPLAGCGDDGAAGDGDRGGGAAGPGTATSAPAGDPSAPDATGDTATSSPLATPPTTEDLDGREPDVVEPPPAGGVPAASRPTPSTRRTALPGFGEVVVEVRRADGEVFEWCLLLAETPPQRSRGLMEVTDPALGGYDGMLFRFEVDSDGGFYMRNTPQPLEIAYVAADGSVVSIREMEPCEDVDGCPTYPAGGPYRWTVEAPVAAGGVGRLGIDEGGGVRVVDTARTCPP